MNQQERNEYQKKRRALNGNIDTKKYEKTKSGFLVRLYRNMKSRVTGVQKLKSHLYENKSLLTKDNFYEWANNSNEFHSLFKIWEDSGYERRLTPSVDRINSALGYEISNMEWIPFHENCRRGALSKLKIYYGK